MQREFAQMGVQWRVADAKAAGLHPLYALGGNIPTFSPTSGVGIQAPATGGEGRRAMGRALADAGQTIGRAVAAQETADQRMTRQAQLATLAAQSEKDYAIASYYRSRAAVDAAQAGAPFPDMGNAAGWVSPGSGGSGSLIHQGGNVIDKRGNVIAPSVMFDRIEHKPGTQVSRSSNFPSQEAGVSPHWKTYQFSDRGMLIDLPAGSSASEAWESLAESKLLLWMVVNHNMEKYGPAWLGGFIDVVPDLFK